MEIRKKMWVGVFFWTECSTDKRLCVNKKNIDEKYRKYDSPGCKVIASGKSMATSTIDEFTTDVAFACIKYEQCLVFTGI